MRLLTAAVTSMALMLAATAATAAPIEIKFSHVVAENTPKGQMANKFAELVGEALQVRSGLPDAILRYGSLGGCLFPLGLGVHAACFGCLF